MICRQCNSDRPIEHFYRDRSRPRGRVARCKVCYRHTQKTVVRLKPYRRESEAKRNAFKRGVDWTLSRDQFMTFWQSPCSYCGDGIDTIGLDRIDNQRGYTMDNVVPCCGRCNSMKSDLSRDQFVERCQRIAANASIATGNVRYR